MDTNINFTISTVKHNASQSRCAKGCKFYVDDADNDKACLIFQRKLVIDASARPYRDPLCVNLTEKLTDLVAIKT